MYDVIVVGSGCVGGWVAKELTERGASVLVVDGGPRLTFQEATTPQAIEASRDQQVQSLHPAYSPETGHLYVKDVDHPYTTPTDKPFHWIRSRQVGGRSLLWGGLTVRFSDYEFQPRDEEEGRWPLTYEELAPFYDRVERYFGVVGQSESLPQLPDGTFDSPAPMTAAEVYFKDKIRRKWPDRVLTNARAIPSLPIGHYSTEWPRLSSLGSTLKSAEATGNMVLRSDAVVVRVEIDPASGWARGVTWVDRRSKRTSGENARVVVLCASTLESTRILMNSDCSRFPNGIGADSGALGRYLTDHPTDGYLGIAPGLEQTYRPFSGPESVYMPRFRNLEAQRGDYRRGFQVWGGLGRNMPFVLPFIEEHIEKGAHFAWFATGEALPRRENYVRLNPDKKDPWGIPTLHIDCSWGENLDAILRDAEHCVAEMCDLAGLEILERAHLRTPGLFVHELGTARMGSSRESSVLNPNCQCWDVPNLFVTDGACFPSAGHQNPTLTMMALAGRTCEHILARMSAREL